MSKNRLARPDAEYALLARIVINPDEMATVLGKITPADFSNDSYGKVYDFIQKRYVEQQPIDSVIVQASTGVQFDPLNLPSGATAPVTSYVETIVDASTRRSISDKLTGVVDQIRGSDDEPVSLVESAVESILGDQSRSGIVSPKEALAEYAEVVARRASEPAGYAYGIPGLDDILLPAKPGRLIMIAARPSVGKTAMAETIADEWSTHGPVVFATLEMSREELIDRAIARDTGIDLEDIIRGTAKIPTEAIKAREDRPIYYIEDKVTTGEIRATAARVKMANGGKLAGVFIDYLQLLADPGDSEIYRIGNISHASKRMARALGCPVVALVQFNRAIEAGEKPRAPRLSDMRDSGVLEQDADVVVALVGNPGQRVREAHVLKHRQGRIGRTTLFFDGPHMRFEGDMEY